MKQHIDIKDLEQLTEAGKERLRKWWVPVLGDFAVLENYNYSGQIVFVDSMPMIFCDGKIYYRIMEGVSGHITEALPLLSIGRMFEFIGKKWYAIGLIYWMDEEVVSPEELCDILWSACVEKLNKEERGKFKVKKVINKYKAIVTIDRDKPLKYLDGLSLNQQEAMERRRMRSYKAPKV